MKHLIHLTALAVLLGSPVFFTSCSTSEVQDTRQSGLERRQSRMDSRTEARQERWRTRAEREDARADARFNSW